MEEDVEKQPQTVFKKPVLIGKVGKLPRKAESSVNCVVTSNDDDSVGDNDNILKSNLPPALLLKEISVPIPYKEPKWSGLPEEGTEYYLEVLKSGVIIEKIDLGKKAYHVFGRLANCDVVMAHPTISRHHAVLQYKAIRDEGTEQHRREVGFYVYDLGSTHGTFLNKVRLKPNQYARMRVGHMMKLGCSTRCYILQGPDTDVEEELELTVTELKQREAEMKREREAAIRAAVDERLRCERDRAAHVVDNGATWGMGDDAVEETELAVNPYSTTCNEELYLDDPKRTLRGYFEREGVELTYQCEERGVGQYLCRVELPLDDAAGRPLSAEVLHKGKKKDAVLECALEACRVLDRHGLLRQAQHESRARRTRDWSADDFYDSDEDNFLDRTGSIETKRERRMQRYGARETDKPLTYQELLNKCSSLEKSIRTEECHLAKLRKSSKREDQESEAMDSLDTYMNNLSGRTMSDKAEISKIKMNIQKLKSELSGAQRLAEVARPADLPALTKMEHMKQKPTVKTHNSIVYGRRIQLRNEKKPKLVEKQSESKPNDEFIEENDSDDDENDVEARLTCESHDQGNSLSKTVSPDDARSIELSNSGANDPISRIISNPDETSGSKNYDDIKITDDIKHKGNNNISKISDKSNDVGSHSSKKPDAYTGTSKRKNDTSDNPEFRAAKRVYGPMRPPENYVVPDSYFDGESDRDLPEITEHE